MTALLVFLGGGIGSVVRYLVGLGLPFKVGHFPLATFVVNVLGSFLIGVIAAFAVKFDWNESCRLALTVGLCGGFTTFSTFSREGLSFVESGRWGLFALYAVGSVALGVGATALGFFIGKQ